MITAKDVDEVIKRGLSRFSQPYDVIAEKIQIVFSRPADKVEYYMAVEGVLKNSVTLKQLIGNNIYNGIVEGKISGLLKKLCTEKGMKILAGMKADQVYYQLRQGETIIRAIQPAEFLN